MPSSTVNIHPRSCTMHASLAATSCGLRLPHPRSPLSLRMLHGVDRAGRSGVDGNVFCSLRGGQTPNAAAVTTPVHRPSMAMTQLAQCSGQAAILSCPPSDDERVTRARMRRFRCSLSAFSGSGCTWPPTRFAAKQAQLYATLLDAVPVSRYRGLASEQRTSSEDPGSKDFSMPSRVS